MTCFVCEEGSLIAKRAGVEGVIKGESYTVEVDALVCDSCGHVAMEGATTQEFMRLVADEYRKKNGLLTSTQIRNIRGALSQRKFAIQLGAGVASVKRWEAGLVQEAKSDKLLREFALRGKRRWSYEVDVKMRICAPKGMDRLEAVAHSPPFTAQTLKDFLCS